MASVTDIKAVSYDVCGVVQIVSGGFKAKVDPQFLNSNFVTYTLPVCQFNLLARLFSR